MKCIILSLCSLGVVVSLAACSDGSDSSESVNTPISPSMTAVASGEGGEEDASSPTLVPTPGGTPTPLPSYPCEAGEQCTCSDFQVRSEAQRIFDKHGRENWAGLDPDGDRVVCQNLP